MSRIRTVKPDFWRHQELSECSAEAALLAIGLLNHCDDEGYFRANPKLIKADVFPLRDLSEDVPILLQELSNMGYISLFTGIDEKKYGLVNNFLIHQRIDKPSASKIKGFIVFGEHSESAPVTLTSGKEEEEEEEEEQGTGTGNREGEREEDKAAQQGKIVSTKLAGDEVHHRGEPLSSMDINFPTTGKGRFVVSQKDINDWQSLHPLIDVAQECRNMVGWLSDNKNKQRPRNQMRKFCSGWLARQSSDAGKRMVQSSSSSRTAKNIQAAKEALREN